MTTKKINTTTAIGSLSDIHLSFNRIHSKMNLLTLCLQSRPQSSHKRSLSLEMTTVSIQTFPLDASCLPHGPSLFYSEPTHILYVRWMFSPGRLANPPYHHTLTAECLQTHTCHTNQCSLPPAVPYTGDYALIQSPLFPLITITEEKTIPSHCTA